jgi:hypothetical protein
MIAQQDSELADAAIAAGQAAAQVFGLPDLRDKAGRQGGDVAGLGTGSSIDFHDQRNYLPGDDVRHINWQAYGRTGTYTMKLFREEVQPLVDVIIDCSSSMYFDPDKARRSLELVAFVAFAVARSQASGRFWKVGVGHPVPIAAEDIVTGRWTHEIKGGGEWDGDLAEVPLRRSSVRLLVGDLLHEGPPSTTLLPLAEGAGLVLVWAPFCHEEAEPSWRENCELEDAESGSRRAVWCDAGMLGRYHDAYMRHFALWEDKALRLGARLARIASDGPLDEALLAVAGEDRAVRLCR